MQQDPNMDFRKEELLVQLVKILKAEVLEEHTTTS
jgi:hypothetical protein